MTDACLPRRVRSPGPVFRVSCWRGPVSFKLRPVTEHAAATLTVRPLTPETWDAFADLAQRHNGVWGGCWCTWFHLYPDPPERRELGNREFKRTLVETGCAHAALVFDDDVAVAWAEYGPVGELPNIHHRKEWEQGVVHRPDYRITCLFVDRRYRRKGVAAVAVRGALELIAAAGGGLVESYPHDLPD